MHVGFRSWRETGITWLALAGVDVTKTQRRAGHDHITTTMGYVKQAEDITGRIRRALSPAPPRTSSWALQRHRTMGEASPFGPRIGPS
jgi:hypothetical protein